MFLNTLYQARGKDHHFMSFFSQHNFGGMGSGFFPLSKDENLRPRDVLTATGSKKRADTAGALQDLPVWAVAEPWSLWSPPGAGERTRAAHLLSRSPGRGQARPQAISIHAFIVTCCFDLQKKAKNKKTSVLFFKAQSMTRHIRITWGGSAPGAESGAPWKAEAGVQDSCS